jgi:hypothetical protein
MSGTIDGTVTIVQTSTLTIDINNGNVVVTTGGTTGPVNVGTTITTGGTTTPVNADTNTYPLAMPSGIAAGAPVTLGTGPNSIQLTLSNNPGTPGNCEFVVIMQQGTVQTAIAGPLTVTAGVGASMAGSQIFTINGDFTGMTGFEITAYGTGLNGMWVNSATVGLIPWECNADAANSRGTGSPNYQPTIFNSNGTNMVFLPASAIPAQPIPTPAPALTTIPATIAGSPRSDTLANLMVDLTAGQTLTLPAGTFVGTGAINVAGTVTGVAMGTTTINCTGLEPYQDKAVLLPTVPGVTIANLTIEGAAIAASLGANAAGVRDGAAGIGFTLSQVEITGCQDGILTFPSNVTVNSCNIHGNGAGLAGGSATHELYIGGSPITTFSMTNTSVATGPLATHALKSRAGTTKVVGGTLTAGAADGGAVSGSVVDIPDGGDASFNGVAFTLRAGAANTLFFGYAMESALNLAAGSTVTMTNCVFDGGGVAGEIQAGSNIHGAALVLSGCTYKGTTPPSVSGFATVVGTITAAS